MTTFGLVHGAWQGAWCWDPLAEVLRSRGHTVIAMDLPAGDPTAGARRYAEVVADALAGVGDDPVLVGHSLGGLTIPLVAGLRPVRRLVYLAPLLALPGHSHDQQRAADPAILRRGLGAGQVGHEDGSSSWRPGPAIEVMYPDAPPELAAWAAARLRRQCWTITAEVTPLVAWPRVPATVIVCAGDRVVDPERARVHARERLGVQAVELPGDHSPFLSRPAALADLLA